MIIARRTLLKAALGAPLLFAGTQAALAATTHQVAIKGFAFNAPDISIKVGDTIQFTNEDKAPHTATAEDGSFNTGTLKRGKSGAITFAAAGEFAYFCKFHRKMRGVVRVTA